MKFNSKKFKKMAFALSAILMIAWALLGTGTSLAWFSDESEEVENIFHVAKFDLRVSYLTENGYVPLDAKTDVFDDNALYEPGYVQVVYLKVENEGTVPFEFQTSVSVFGYVPATNYFGQTFNLQNYLRFGVVGNYDEAELKDKLSNREKAKTYATEALNNYSTNTEVLGAGEETYIAVIVRMPEEIGNVANYRGTPPKVELGLIVNANQVDMP